MASRARLEKVEELIEGFETPYGMELLSSVHWVAKRSVTPAADAASAVASVHAWNDRKRSLFKARTLGSRGSGCKRWVGSTVAVGRESHRQVRSV